MCLAHRVSGMQLQSVCISGCILLCPPSFGEHMLTRTFWRASRPMETDPARVVADSSFVAFACKFATSVQDFSLEHSVRGQRSPWAVEPGSGKAFRTGLGRSSWRSKQLKLPGSVGPSLCPETDKPVPRTGWPSDDARRLDEI